MLPVANMLKFYGEYLLTDKQSYMGRTIKRKKNVKEKKCYQNRIRIFICIYQ